MPSKDFENFELRLKTLREDSREDFDSAQKVFQDTFKTKLEEIFPRDILGAKNLIAGSFIIDYVDRKQLGTPIDAIDVFKKSVGKVVSTLKLSQERKISLEKNILSTVDISQELKEYFNAQDTISRDPFFALVEDFSMDGVISKEEFLVLQQEYEKQGDFLKALESLPDVIRSLFHAHIELTLGNDHTQKRGEFESEYSQELGELQGKGINIEPVVVFVSRSFYKTPGKYRKFEHPKRRMRRTFKLALLKLLRIKVGNIDAKIMLERFEKGENFEDIFMLLFRVLEVINEDPAGEEIYSVLKLEEDTQSDVFTAEENKQKILAGESLVMSIASLFSRADSKKEEEELGEGILEKILDETTDIVGEDIYFNREDENVGVYADQSSSLQEEADSEDEEEIDYESMSPESAYELLKRDFHKIEEEKRQAFLKGEYDEIDVYNESLLSIQLKLEKLCKILGESDR